MSDLITPGLMTPQARSAQGGGTGLDEQVYNRLLRERIIFLGSVVEDANANLICAQLLLLAADDPHKDIWLYINSPGWLGLGRHGHLRHDAVRQERRRDRGDGAGRVDGAVPALRRRSRASATRLPHARVMMHQPSGGLGGTASDIRIQAEQMLYTKAKMAELIAGHTGQTVEQIEADSDRDRWFTAEEAKEYGMVDLVAASAGQVAGDGGTA